MRADGGPVRVETESALWLGKSRQEMRVFKGWRAINPAALRGLVGITLAGSFKRRFDQFPGGHIETRMLRAESFGQRIHHFDIAAAFAEGLQHPRPDGERRVPPSM